MSTRKTAQFQAKATKSRYSLEYLRSLSPNELEKIMRKAAKRIRKEYCEGGSLAGFEAMDDILDYPEPANAGSMESVS